MKRALFWISFGVVILILSETRMSLLGTAANNTFTNVSKQIRGSGVQAQEPRLRAGFGEVDITPQLGDKPVYMAGFGHGRQATGVHDRLYARAVVLTDGQHKLALVAV